MDGHIQTAAELMKQQQGAHGRLGAPAVAAAPPPAASPEPPPAARSGLQPAHCPACPLHSQAHCSQARARLRCLSTWAANSKCAAACAARLAPLARPLADLGQDFEEALAQPDAPGKVVQITVSAPACWPFRMCCPNRRSAAAALEGRRERRFRNRARRLSSLCCSACSGHCIAASCALFTACRCHDAAIAVAAV